MLKNNLIFIFLIITIFFSIQSCKDNLSGPNIRIDSGVKGIVTDSLGNRLDSVKIYCTYNTIFAEPGDLHWFPPLLKLSPYKISSEANFEFNLEQNFPNPVSNSTYLRYAIPDDAEVILTIIDKYSGNFVYSSSQQLTAGYYQQHINNFVDSLHLINGPYIYRLIALCKDGTRYEAEKEMVVISIDGNPNYTTQKDGFYVFDYKRVFEDREFYYCYEGEVRDSIILTNSVNLVFKKKGYHLKNMIVNLNPESFVDQNVILTKK